MSATENKSKAASLLNPARLVRSLRGGRKNVDGSSSVDTSMEMEEDTDQTRPSEDLTKSRNVQSLRLSRSSAVKSTEEALPSRHLSTRITSSTLAALGATKKSESAMLGSLQRGSLGAREVELHGDSPAPSLSNVGKSKSSSGSKLLRGIISRTEKLIGPSSGVQTTEVSRSSVSRASSVRMSESDIVSQSSSSSKSTVTRAPSPSLSSSSPSTAPNPSPNKHHLPVGGGASHSHGVTRSPSGERTRSRSIEKTPTLSSTTTSSSSSTTRLSVRPRSSSREVVGGSLPSHVTMRSSSRQRSKPLQSTQIPMNDLDLDADTAFLDIDPARHSTGSNYSNGGQQQLLHSRSLSNSYQLSAQSVARNHEPVSHTVTSSQIRHTADEFDTPLDPSTTRPQSNRVSSRMKALPVAATVVSASTALPVAVVLDHSNNQTNESLGHAPVLNVFNDDKCGHDSTGIDVSDHVDQTEDVDGWNTWTQCGDENETEQRRISQEQMDAQVIFDADNTIQSTSATSTATLTATAVAAESVTPSTFALFVNLFRESLGQMDDDDDEESDEEGDNHTPDETITGTSISSPWRRDSSLAAVKESIAVLELLCTLLLTTCRVTLLLMTQLGETAETQLETLSRMFLPQSMRKSVGGVLPYYTTVAQSFSLCLALAVMLLETLVALCQWIWLHMVKQQEIAVCRAIILFVGLVLCFLGGHCATILAAFAALRSSTSSSANSLATKSERQRQKQFEREQKRHRQQREERRQARQRRQTALRQSLGVEVTLNSDDEEEVAIAAAVEGAPHRGSVRMSALLLQQQQQRQQQEQQQNQTLRAIEHGDMWSALQTLREDMQAIALVLSAAHTPAVVQHVHSHHHQQQQTASNDAQDTSTIDDSANQPSSSSMDNRPSTGSSVTNNVSDVDTNPIQTSTEPASEIKKEPVQSLSLFELSYLLVSAIDPQRLSMALFTLGTRLMAVLVTLRYSFAQTIALSQTLTLSLETLARGIAVHCIPALQHHHHRHHRHHSDDDEKRQLANAHQHEPSLQTKSDEQKQRVLRGWVFFLITCLSRLIAVYIAWSLRRLVAAVYAALRGGRMVARNLQALCNVALTSRLPPELHSYVPLVFQGLGYALGALGIYVQWQYRYVGLSGWPWPIRLLLGPVLCLEHVLVWLVHSGGFVGSAAAVAGTGGTVMTTATAVSTTASVLL